MTGRNGRCKLHMLEYYEARDRYRRAADKRRWERREFEQMTEEEKKAYVKKYGYVKESRVEDLEDAMNYRRRDYEQARFDYARMPRWREEDEIQVWRYPIYQEVKEAELSVTITIADARTGAILAQDLLARP